MSYDLSAELLQMARSDEAGVPLAGRSAEIEALREAGRLDPSLGRIFEGHVNAAQLIARCGTPQQRERLDREILEGRIFGVWNTQDSGGVTIEERGHGFALKGAKTWASGAGSITRAIVTAASEDASLQMCLVPMDRVAVEIDASQWDPLGMERSDSFRVDFSGVELTRDDLIGKPNDYNAQPWFFGGALRFLAVQTGIIDRLESEAVRYLVARSRHADPFQQQRAAHVRVAAQTCRHWLVAGANAWRRYDAQASDAAAAAVLDVVDMARVVVERAALEVIENVVRSVGARGLVEPLPFARLIRDLQMYLRQPAPDAVVLRVGETAFREANADRNPAIASSTGTISQRLGRAPNALDNSATSS